MITGASGRRARAALLMSCVVAPVAHRAQAQAIDSMSLGIESRYRWHGYDRGPGPVLTSNVSFALAGFSTNRMANERNNLTADLLAWIPPTDRVRRRGVDHYAATLGYGRCVAACDQNAWRRRTTLAASATAHWLPNSTRDAWSPTVELALRHYINLEKIGDTQVGINLSPFVTLERGRGQFEGTFTRAGIGTSLGPMGGFSLSLDGAIAFSDWPALSGAARGFGYHDADVAIGIDHDRRVGFSRHLSTRLTIGAELPHRSIGAATAVVGLRFKLSGPVLMLQ